MGGETLPPRPAVGSGESATWKPLPDAPGWFYNDATGETRFDQNVAGAFDTRRQQDFERDQQLRSTPSSSSSYNVSQSYADPASLDLQRQQMEQEWQALLLRDAVDRAQLDFSRDKLRVETEAGQRADARATQQLMEQIEARRVNTQMQAAELRYRAAAEQASLAMQAQLANQRAQAEASQINESRRQFNLQQQRGVAQDIAQFVGDPSSVGKNAAYYLAGSSQGNTGISRAMAEGQVGYDKESLNPLDLLLGQRQELAQGPQLFQPSMVSAPSFSAPDLSFLNAPSGGAAPAAPGGMGGASSTPTVYTSGVGLPTPQAGTQGTGFQPAGIDPETGNLRFTAMAQGGYTNARLFKGDEKGPELYVNPTGAPIMVVPNDMAEGVPGFEEGTGFGSKRGDLFRQVFADMRQNPQNFVPMGTVGRGLFGSGGGMARMEEGVKKIDPELVRRALEEMRRSDLMRRLAMDAGRIPGFAEGTLYQGVQRDVMSDGLQFLNGQPVFGTYGQGTYGGPGYADREAQDRAINDARGWNDPANLWARANPGNSQPNPYLPAPTQTTLAPRPTPEEFLKQTYDKALTASPWARTGAPTAVGLSGPGTSPYIQQYGSALAALRGFNPYLYLSEAQGATPVGLTGAPTRRTR